MKTGVSTSPCGVRMTPARARPSRETTSNEKRGMIRGEYSGAPMQRRLTVALLFGGRSGEHEVSLRSAASVAAGLAARHDVACVLVDKQGRWLLQEGPSPRAGGGEPVFLAPSPEDGGRLRRLADAREALRPDVYFPVLHGTYGEDGTVQGLFELAAVPYVGAGVAASAASMDKEMMKALFAQAGLPQVEHRTLREGARDLRAEASLVG